MNRRCFFSAISGALAGLAANYMILPATPKAFPGLKARLELRQRYRPDPWPWTHSDQLNPYIQKLVDETRKNHL